MSFHYEKSYLVDSRLESLENLDFDGGLGSNRLIGRGSVFVGLSELCFDAFGGEGVQWENLDGGDVQLGAWEDAGKASRDEIFGGGSAGLDDLDNTRGQFFNKWNVVGEHTQFSRHSRQIDLGNFFVGEDGLFVSGDDIGHVYLLREGPQGTASKRQG
ncbi:hypothetical protein OGAPHI_000601 [Ogataea philodendri]|uniref:Uncharacterized protein n=1 Tax=Ogataea philodendri TaxID=1378263 RepID=A0A9P8PFX0_9ASCO|nr:uncharacterized protein OGAPHI_000601 [Ogataea philodendri]KAH3670890.1 hypothetical protein OGAPHI_000601 [Ogataea philodendri]